MEIAMDSGVRKFKLTASAGRWPHKASRYALSELTGGKKKKKKGASNNREIMQDTRTLIATWRKRIIKLRRAGWEKVLKPRDYVYAANCPPVGVVTDQRDLKPCQQSRICPWCWCRRYVWKAWDQFDGLLFPNKKAGIPPFDLIEIRTDRAYSTSEWTLDQLLLWIKDAKGDYVKVRLKEAVGSFVLCSLVPPRLHEDIPRWRMKHRVLSIVPATFTGQQEYLMKFTEDPGMTMKRVVKRTEMPNRAGLAAAIGRTCLYPKMMMVGSAKPVADLLNYQLLSPGAVAADRKPLRVRMAEFYGALRNSAAMKLHKELARLERE